ETKPSRIKNDSGGQECPPNKLNPRFSRLSLRLRGRLFLLRPVDLRLLQLVGVIHVHRLPLGIEVDGADAAFAVTVAGGLGAAEGKVNFRSDGWRIDVGDSRLKIADRSKRLVHILCVEGRRQAVLNVV